ncbi:MAG: hypothetical protein WD005_06380 [Haliea sp.]
MAAQSVCASRVRYIKLGEGGSDEKECFKNGILKIGFGSEVHFELCENGKWKELEEQYRAEGRKRGKPKEFANQVREFFEDDGKTLWITFSGRQLWWAFVDGEVSAKPCDENSWGTFRPVRGEWKSTDIHGNALHMDSLSGRLTQLAAYRGTSCKVKEFDYVLRRINGERLPVVREAEQLSKRLQGKIVEMVRLLAPQDFELLTDLVFSGSGWRRQGVVGKNEKTVDMVLVLPTTGERAFIQVKSTARQTEFDNEYREAFTNMAQFGRMFYVYHTGEIACTDPGVTTIGPDRFAEMVLDAGLSSWLIQRVS